MGFYQQHVLPQLLDRAMRNSNLTPYRTRTLALASGRVLEIGIGSGLNLPIYTDRAIKIIGLDSHPESLAMTSRQISKTPVVIVQGTAESLPLDARSVDTVVSTWTLCSIPAIEAALAEIHRVLKPDGQFLFVEHGLSPDAGVRKWQHRLTPLWKHIAGGCHLDRPISQLVHDAGFETVQLENSYMRGPRPMTFMYEGAARPR